MHMPRRAVRHGKWAHARPQPGARGLARRVRTHMRHWSALRADGQAGIRENPCAAGVFICLPFTVRFGRTRPGTPCRRPAWPAGLLPRRSLRFPSPGAPDQQSVQPAIVPSSSHRSCQSFAPGHRNTCPLTSRLFRSSVAMVAISASVSFSVTAALRFAS